MALVTEADVLDYLNPNDSSRKIQAGVISASRLATIVANAEKQVWAHCPEEYRKLRSCVSGYWFTHGAATGDAEFAVPEIALVPSSVVAWKNPTFAWVDRHKYTSDAEALTILEDDGAYSIELDEPLAERDVLIADIYHSGAGIPQLLKTYALNLAVVDTIRSFPTLAMGAELRMNYETLRQETREDLARLLAGKLKIDEWDELDLIPENETAWRSEGTGTIDGTSW